jgi:hypothetical protein
MIGMVDLTGCIRPAPGTANLLSGLATRKRKEPELGGAEVELVARPKYTTSVTIQFGAPTRIEVPAVRDAFDTTLLGLGFERAGLLHQRRQS